MFWNVGINYMKAIFYSVNLSLQKLNEEAQTPTVSHKNKNYDMI